MQVQEAGLELSEAERRPGGQLLKLALETDRVEGYNEQHAVAVARLAVKLGSRMGLRGRDLTALKFAALAHDLGERLLKARYLLRPLPLSREERLDLGRHPILGEQAAASQLRLPREVQLLIRWHHEWWNGTGYPDALAGEAIPLAARILRAADTWCALNSDRPWRTRYGRATAEQMVQAQAGIELDPQVVRTLMELLASEDRARRSSDPPFLFAPPENEPPVSSSEGEPSFSSSEDESSVSSSEDEPSDPASFAFGEYSFDPQLLNQVAFDYEYEDEMEPAAEEERIPSPGPFAPNRRWLGFELSVLSRLGFRSIAIPFTGRPELGWYLKFWGKQVLANDPRHWAWWGARALVENRGVVLTSEDVERLLEGAERSRGRLANPALRHWMSEQDAVWFDNLWRNIEEIDSVHRQALARLHAFAAGDYVFSFGAETAHLRRPLGEVYTALWRNQRPVVDNSQEHAAFNLDAHEFVSRVKADLMFVRLPGPGGLYDQRRSAESWRETWVRGGEGWREQSEGGEDRLGAAVYSKEHYLELVENFFKQARGIPRWAIAHADESLVSVGELSELANRFRRRVKAYAKDFSHLLGGSRAYIITAE